MTNNFAYDDANFENQNSIVINPMLELDPQGDAILKVENNAWLVSTAVLSAASPVFEAMFRGESREAQAIRAGNCPTITLEYDHPASVDLILRLLHFQEVDLTEMRYVDLACVAVQADKYGLARALPVGVLGA